ncbi:MAG: hypothetical protein M3O91_11125 [Chloroflexota bacterium]|nr:hypothetical protein [Chloroflexota bacterium]
MALPLLTTVVAAVFAVFVLAQWIRKRRPYQLVWGIGLLMFAVAAGAGFVARSSGVAEADYRVFYLFGAILNVAWLGLGTIFLLAPRRVADVALAAVVLFSAVSAFVVFSTPVDVAAAGDTGKGFQDAPPRVLAGIGSGVGSVVLIAGALWSAWGFMRRRHQGRRALANVVIAVGVLIVAAGGTVAFTGASGILETTNLVGIAVMFAGFLLV